MEIALKNPLISEGGIIRWLGGKSKVRKPVQSDFDLIALSDEGITKASVDLLAGHIGLSKKVFAENILDISIKTLERKKASDKLDKRISSQVLEIARVLDHALVVFNDPEKLRSWLHKPNRALNNQKPVLLFSTLTGLNMVNDILGRIEEGVYS